MDSRRVPAVQPPRSSLPRAIFLFFTFSFFLISSWLYFEGKRAPIEFDLDLEDEAQLLDIDCDRLGPARNVAIIGNILQLC